MLLNRISMSILNLYCDAGGTDGITAMGPMSPKRMHRRFSFEPVEHLDSSRASVGSTGSTPHSSSMRSKLDSRPAPLQVVPLIAFVTICNNVQGLQISCHVHLAQLYCNMSILHKGVLWSIRGSGMNGLVLPVCDVPVTSQQQQCAPMLTG